MKKEGKQKYFRIMPYTFPARITSDISFFSYFPKRLTIFKGTVWKYLEKQLD